MWPPITRLGGPLLHAEKMLEQQILKPRHIGQVGHFEAQGYAVAATVCRRLNLTGPMLARPKWQHVALIDRHRFAAIGDAGRDIPLPRLWISLPGFVRELLRAMARHEG